ncbi:MAG: hypothetical protein HY430_02885 [Candidatus Levybacteria bacterium]|nr:hypothetical protein [Candidatus Levybacteria bacterium]
MTANFSRNKRSNGTNLERTNAMSKPITREQSHAIATTLVANIDWGQLDGCGDLLQENVVRAAKVAGFHATAFLKAGARMPCGDLLIATAPFKPEEFIGKKWKILTDEQDKRSAELKEVDFSKANFLNCLTEDEIRDGSYITGEEKFSRLKKEKTRIRYGAAVFMGLWLDYKARGKESVLERLYQEQGITYMDFFGDILGDPSGHRNVLFLSRHAVGTWNWYYHWLFSAWYVSYLSVVSSQVSVLGA